MKTNCETKFYLAIDLGAGSGRHIVGFKKCGEICQDEVYRFPNAMKEDGASLVWDIEYLFEQIKKGISEAFKKYPKIESLAIDTWGVDYVLMKNDKEILPCYGYRDARMNAVLDEVHNICPFEFLYSKTGIQFEPYNTVYQLYADKKAGRLDKADTFLMMPEYFSYKLTGIMKKEYTDATTTGLVNAKTKEFDSEIIKKLDFKKDIFKQLSQPGEIVGSLSDEVANEVGGQTTVRFCASHDTASAFEGIAFEDDAIFISSGTWSLVGAKLNNPITTAQSLSTNFANEGGVGYIRFLKNITGMWINSKLKDEFKMEFSDMTALAKTSEFSGIFDVNDQSFSAPKSMSQAIKNWFLESGEAEPKTKADYIISAYRSLAYAYKKTIEEIEMVTQKTYTKIYIAGGGAKNEIINAYTKAYTGKDVVALAVEATALGNLKIQMQNTITTV